MRSIQRHLNLRIVAGTSLLLLLAGLVIDRRVSGALHDGFDRALRAKARALMSLSEQDGGVIELDFTEELMPELWKGERADGFEVWVDGKLLAGSSNLGTTRLARLPGGSPELRCQDVLLPDGGPGRLLQVDFVPRVEGEGGAGEGTVLKATLVLARWRGDLDASVAEIRIMLAAVSAVLLLAIAGVVRAATRRGLMPLAEVGRQVQRLNAEVLHERVHVVEPVVEVAPLVAKINSLLASLEAAFRRERQLSSDVAHELRTPVAELRSLAEVGGRWPDNREDVEAFFRDVHDIALQMERIIASLLALARCDGGAEPLAADPVRLSEVVAASWSGLLSQATSRGIALAVRGSDETVITDAAKLRSIIDNILGNAVDYAPEGTEVRCVMGPGPKLAISNLAPHLAADDLPHLFDRFWRKDPARTGAQHAGLGLALARAFAGILGGALHASLEGAWLVLTLDLPSTPSRGPAVAPAAPPARALAPAAPGGGIGSA